MAVVIRYTNSDASELYRQIIACCKVQLKEGCEYPYNHETKTISSKATGDDLVVVCSILTQTPTELHAIVPYDVVRRLSLASQPGLQRISPWAPSLNPIFRGSLRDYQASGAMRVIKMLKDTGRCYLQAPPGYGKTVIMSYVISEIREPTLIITSRTALAEQTKTSVEEMLGNVKVHILETDREVPDDVDVVISFTRRINGTSAPFKRFKTVVFDEVHELSTKLGIAAMLTVRPNHLLALTATPGDRNKITELFVGKCEIEELGTKRWSVCFPRVISDLGGVDYSKMKGYTDAMGDLCSSESYIKTIARMINYFVSQKKRVIALTIRVEMCANLVEELNPFNISSSILSPDNRTCPNCDVIIGTHRLIGTGFDLKNYVDDFDGKSVDVMIFLGSFKNATMFFQTAGRCFRSSYPLAVFPMIVGLKVSESHTKKLIAEAKRTRGCVVLNEYAKFLERFNAKH